MTPWAELAGARRHAKVSTVSAFVTDCAAIGLVDVDDRLSVVDAAACWLAPAAGPPPAGLLDALHRLVEECSARQENATNVAVAFGAGWGRSRACSTGPDSSWTRIWDRAIFAVVDEFERSVDITCRRLVRMVPDLVIDQSERTELAQLLAVQFVRGCRCGRHRRACAARDAHGCCIAEHSLCNWDPAVAHLSAYVDQAVRGIAGSSLLGAAFADGMLYAELRRDGRLHRATVEAQQCSCGETFEATRCPACDDNQTRTGPYRRVARVNRLVVPRDAGGRYVVRQRWQCGHESCGSYYPRTLRHGVVDSQARCPVCGWRPEGRKPQSRQLWVRLDPQRVDPEVAPGWDPA